jgi:hypothetical protein
MFSRYRQPVCSMPPRDSEDWGIPEGAEDEAAE